MLRDLKTRGSIRTYGAYESPGGDAASTITKSNAILGDADFLELLAGRDLLFDQKLPEVPYADDCFFASTTFRSTAKTPPPTKLLDAIEDLISKMPLKKLQIQKKHEWELEYEFVHLGRNNEFRISFFEDNTRGEAHACLVEISKISGEHVPFQNLAEIIRQKFQLVYALGELSATSNDGCCGDKVEFFSDDCAPPKLDLKLDLTCCKFESTEFEFDSSLDIVLENVKSPYADVQVRGWDTLEQMTRTKDVAKELLKRKIDGRDALKEIQSYVDSSIESCDQQRLISRTMQNIIRVEPAAHTMSVPVPVC